MGDDLGDEWLAEELDSSDEGTPAMVAAAGESLMPRLNMRRD